MMEKWKNIKDLKGRYIISNLGKVKNVKTNKIVNPYNNGHNIMVIRVLNKDGIFKNLRISILVATAFLKKTKNELVVLHKNRNKKDNRLNNLVWATKKEANNINREINNKNYKKNDRRTILDREDVKKIKIYLNNGKKSIWISEKFNVSPEHITNIKHGRRWSSVAI